MTTALFSGRFDRPHLGHAITIARLGARYEHVIVTMLDYKEAMFPMVERLESMTNILLMLEGSYQVIVSPHHFGSINVDQLRELPHFDVYATGNEKVFKAMRVNSYLMEFTCELIPRYPEYAASDDKKFQKIKEIMKDE